MISLIFEGGGLATETITVGPTGFFRVGGNFIHKGLERVIVASYRNHFWEVQGKYFTRYDSKDPVMLYFENAMGESSESFGPFAYFWCADGVFYTEDKLFAKFMEKSQLWHCYATDTYWPMLVISALDCA